MRREMILDEKRRQISGNIDEDTVSFSLFFINVYISLIIFQEMENNTSFTISLTFGNLLLSQNITKR